MNRLAISIAARLCSNFDLAVAVMIDPRPAVPGKNAF